LGGNPLNTR